RLGRPARIREPPARAALRWNAPARRARARPHHGAADPPDGRAVRGARRADQDRDAGGAVAYLRRDPQDHPVRDPCDPGSDPARRRGGGDDGAAGPHQGGDPGRSAAASLARARQHAGVRRAVRPHLPPHPRGGDGRDGATGDAGGGAMRKRPSQAARVAEKLLPAATVAIFLLAWEGIVRARGIAPIYLPAPSTIAIYLWRMIADGTMEYHLGVTLLRIFVGFLIAAVTGIALGVAMGMSRVVASIADIWIAALYPLPKIS